MQKAFKEPGASTSNLVLAAIIQSSQPLPHLRHAALTAEVFLFEHKGTSCARSKILGRPQVARELVGLHSELRRGDLARLEALRRSAPAASSASRREQARPCSFLVAL